METVLRRIGGVVDLDRIRATGAEASNASGPSAAREPRFLKVSSPPMEEGGCDKLKGRRSVLHEDSVKRVKH